MFLDIFVHIPKCAGGTIQEHIESQIPESERFGPHNPYYKQEIARVLRGSERKQCQTDSTLVKRSWIMAYLSSLSPARRNSIRCVYGHAAHYGVHTLFERQPRYFTFLREPLARFVSYYNYIRTARVTPQRLTGYEIQKSDGSLRTVDEWLEEANLAQYSMTGFLLHTLRAENLLQSIPPFGENDLGDIKTMLSSFYFVGLTENKEDMEFVFNQLGIVKDLPDRNVLRKKETYFTPANAEHAQKVVAERFPFDVELYQYAAQLNRASKKNNANFSLPVAL